MFRKFLLATAVFAAALAFSAAPSLAADKPLRIVQIDVEGGAAVLYITPQGHSLLIDAGWPAGMGGPRAQPGAPPPPPSPDSAQRIVAAAKAAGLSRIDYLLLSHYHVDHVGGAVKLMGLIPIGTFVDHGPNGEQPPPTATPQQLTNATVTLYAKYEAAIAGKKRIVMKAGDTLKIDDLQLLAVGSARAVTPRPAPGAGQPGVGCDAPPNPAGNGGDENDYSLGVLFSYGKARVVSLGDTTWNQEAKLVCPINLIGKVDLMFADNHGTANAGSPLLLDNLRPTLVAFSNGVTKGADPDTLDRVRGAASVKAMWQLHFNTRAGDKNAEADHIANVEGGPDAINPLQYAVETSGAITVTNPRTGKSTAYPKVP